MELVTGYKYIGMSDKTKQLRSDLLLAQETLDTLNAKTKAVKPFYDRSKALYRQAGLYELKSMDYDLYLKTEEWQVTRLRAIENAQGKCQGCGALGIELHVHHKTYERRGEELPDDLIVLCKECHAKHHYHESWGKK